MTKPLNRLLLNSFGALFLLSSLTLLAQPKPPPAFYGGIFLSNENVARQFRSIITDRVNDLYHIDCFGCYGEERKITRDFWFGVTGDLTTQKAEDDQMGYRTRSAGLLLGTDHNLCSDFLMGVSGGYMHTDLDWKEGSTKAPTDTFFGSLYSIQNTCGFWLDALFLFDVNYSTSTRYVDTALFRLPIGANPKIWLVDTHLGATYPMPICKFLFAPFISLDGVFEFSGDIDEYAPDLYQFPYDNLSVRSHNASLLRTEVGFKLSVCKVGKEKVSAKDEKEKEPQVHGYGEKAEKPMRWIPSFALSAVRESRFSGDHFSASEYGTDETFEVTTLNPSRTLIDPTLELLILTNHDDMTFTIRYEGEFGSHVSENDLMAKMGFDF